MYTRKSLLGLWVFCEHSLSPGFELFFWLSVGRKLSLFFFEEKLSPGVLDLLTFQKKNHFCWKGCSEALEQYFETFRFAPRENKSMKEFVRFSTTDVFVPVSQLSTRDLFDFLENLKIRQDFLSWVSRLVRSFERRALWFPYSRLFFWNRNVQESVNSWVFGVFYRVNYGVDLRFFWHISKKRCLNCWLVKEIITFESRTSYRECLLFKRLRGMASLWDVIRLLFLWVGSFRCFCNYHVGRHVEWLLVKYMDLLKPVGFSKTHELGAM